MVCDWWECSRREECNRKLLFNGAKYPPCGVCSQFDKCLVCSRLAECAVLIARYLPTMFRRLVREIRLGEDTQRTEQEIRRRTKRSGRKS